MLFMLLLILREAAMMIQSTRAHQQRLASLTQTPPTVSARAASTDYADRIARLYLLGRPEASANAGDPGAPVTPLALHLQGIVAGTRPPVVIIDDGQTQAAYTLGDRIAGQALVKAIYPDHILLERQGRLETLRLEDPTAAATAGQSASESPVTDNGAQPSAQAADQLEQLFKMTAVQQNGVLHGYRIQPDADSELLKQMGLRPQDVLVEIDNTPIGQAQPSPTSLLLQKLWQGHPVALTIERDGKRQKIQVSLDD